MLAFGVYWQPNQIALKESYRSNQVRHNDDQQGYVEEDEAEANQRHHVGRHPQGQKLDKGIPLFMVVSSVSL